VRSLSNPAKVDHLRSLDGAADRLKLFEADLLSPGTFDAALEGCSECHHTASPFFNDGVTDPELQLIRPAVEGTLNVLGSCKTQNVLIIVVTSSTAAVYGRKEGNPVGHVITEEQWADADLAAEKSVHYVVSKIKAERAVWAFAEKDFPEARIVCVNPTLVVGPMLQPAMNTSSGAIAGVSAPRARLPCVSSPGGRPRRDCRRTEHPLRPCPPIFGPSPPLPQFFTGAQAAVPTGFITIVDVRDVVEAHVQAAERATANGRYLLVGGTARWSDLVGERQEGCSAPRFPVPAHSGRPARTGVPFAPGLQRHGAARHTRRPRACFSAPFLALPATTQRRCARALPPTWPPSCRPRRRRPAPRRPGATTWQPR